MTTPRPTINALSALAALLTLALACATPPQTADPDAPAGSNPVLAADDAPIALGDPPDDPAATTAGQPVDAPPRDPTPTDPAADRGAPRRDPLDPDAPPGRADTSGPPPALNWVEWAASRCVPDRVGNTKYARGWLEWAQGDFSFLPEGAPRPIEGPAGLPTPGSARARERAAALERAWLDDPQSRLLDCSFEVPRRSCKGCRQAAGTLKRDHEYTVLLPRALFVEPARVRSILLLIPGGNGGRVRWFLTPIPGKGNNDPMSGGLETRRRVDSWLDAHPEASQPIVVALEHNGWGTANGPTEFLTHDVPTHIASTYLNLPLDQVAVGAEGISSGAMEIWRSLYSRPGAFNTAGIMCMYCADDGKGIRPWGPAVLASPDIQAWLANLKKLRDADLLHVRFSVGNADKGWECNKGLYDAFASAGIFDPRPPDAQNCRTPEARSTADCDLHWDGFHLYRDVGHTYALLPPAWEPQLHWHLERLSRAAAALQR